MLAIVGLVTVLLVLISILTKKLSTMCALIAVPIIACLVLGLGGEMGKFMMAGIKSVAPTGAMFILQYFSLPLWEIQVFSNAL